MRWDLPTAMVRSTTVWLIVGLLSLVGAACTPSAEQSTPSTGASEIEVIDFEEGDMPTEGNPDDDGADGSE